MAEDGGTVRAIDWQEAFVGLRVFSALRLALGFRPLLLAAAALVLTTAGWWVLGEVFSPPGDYTRDIQLRIGVIEGQECSGPTLGQFIENITERKLHKGRGKSESE